MASSKLGNDNSHPRKEFLVTRDTMLIIRPEKPRKWNSVGGPKMWVLNICYCSGAVRLDWEDLQGWGLLMLWALLWLDRFSFHVWAICRGHSCLLVNLLCVNLLSHIPWFHSEALRNRHKRVKGYTSGGCLERNFPFLPPFQELSHPSSTKCLHRESLSSETYWLCHSLGTLWSKTPGSRASVSATLVCCASSFASPPSFPSLPPPSSFSAYHWTCLHKYLNLKVEKQQPCVRR